MRGRKRMTRRLHPESERSLHGLLQSFDLDAEVARLREEKAWQEGRRNAITLRKGEGLNVVLLVMKEGDRLDEHSALGPITLSVHKGHIRFSAADEAVEGGAGTVLACDAGVRHSVEALGEAVCLLNVAMGGGKRKPG
jgi:quercetin dioxygenase-like cupin family protein